MCKPLEQETVAVATGQLSPLQAEPLVLPEGVGCLSLKLGATPLALAGS